MIHRYESVFSSKGVKIMECFSECHPVIAIVIINVRLGCLHGLWRFMATLQKKINFCNRRQNVKKNKKKNKSLGLWLQFKILPYEIHIYYEELLKDCLSTIVQNFGVSMIFESLLCFYRLHLFDQN